MSSHALNLGATGMQDNASIHAAVKQLLVENLMLQVSPSEIRDDQPLFGPDGLGLDSVDALQLVVALDKHYGLKIPDPASPRSILLNVGTIAAAITSHQQCPGATPPMSSK
jgi:acyl carrier protein